MKVYQSKKGYFYKEYKNRKKIRISKETYIKFKLKNKQRGGDAIKNSYEKKLKKLLYGYIYKLGDYKFVSYERETINNNRINNMFEELKEIYNRYPHLFYETVNSYKDKSLFSGIKNSKTKNERFKDLTYYQAIEKATQREELRQIGYNSNNIESIISRANELKQYIDNKVILTTLGEGGFGCISFPGINKNNTGKLIKMNTKVSKFPHKSTNSKIFKNEYEFANKIKTLLKNAYSEVSIDEYFLFPDKLVEIQGNNYNRLVINDVNYKCRRYQKNNKNSRTTILMNKANTDLEKYIKNSIFQRKLTLHKFTEFIHHIAKGVKLAVDQGIALFDLKYLNIVIKDEKPRIIDFDKQFIPTNWDEFINFINLWYDLENNYLWSPEIGSFRNKYSELKKTNNSNNKLKQALEVYIIQVLRIQELTPETWKEFINKAMVYQMSYLFNNINFLPHLSEQMTAAYNDRITLNNLITQLQ